jgi:hypothetical protein
VSRDRCTICGRALERPNSHPAAVCGRECDRERKLRARRAVPQALVCAECGVEYVPQRRDGRVLRRCVSAAGASARVGGNRDRGLGAPAPTREEAPEHDAEHDRANQAQRRDDEAGSHVPPILRPPPRTRAPGSRRPPRTDRRVLECGWVIGQPGQPCRRWSVASLGWSATAHNTWSATPAGGTDGENRLERSCASHSFRCG